MTAFWRNWLMIWCGGVVVFGLVLAGGAFEATSGPVSLIYGLLQGPAPLVLDPVMKFTVALMGCVTIGWAVSMLLVMRAAFSLGAGARPVWMGLTIGLATWFVIDSTLSMATGFGLNAVSNSLLMATFLIAMFGSGVLRRSVA